MEIKITKEQFIELINITKELDLESTDSYNHCVYCEEHYDKIMNQAFHSIDCPIQKLKDILTLFYMENTKNG